MPTTPWWKTEPLGTKLYIYALADFITLNGERKLYTTPMTPMVGYFIGYRKRATGKAYRRRITNEGWFSSLFGEKPSYEMGFKATKYYTVIQFRTEPGGKILEALPEDIDLGNVVDKAIDQKMQELNDPAPTTND